VGFVGLDLVGKGWRLLLCASALMAHYTHHRCSTASCAASQAWLWLASSSACSLLYRLWLPAAVGCVGGGRAPHKYGAFGYVLVVNQSVLARWFWEDGLERDACRLRKVLDTALLHEDHLLLSRASAGENPVCGLGWMRL
jgi:hypothetical protein